MFILLLWPTSSTNQNVTAVLVIHHGYKSKSRLDCETPKLTNWPSPVFWSISIKQAQTTALNLQFLNCQLFNDDMNTFGQVIFVANSDLVISYIIENQVWPLAALLTLLMLTSQSVEVFRLSPPRPNCLFPTQISSIFQALLFPVSFVLTSSRHAASQSRNWCSPAGSCGSKGWAEK